MLQQIGICCVQAAILDLLGAAHSTVATGELYMSKELQRWKLGPPHALDLDSGSTMESMETVYDDGYFL